MGVPALFRWLSQKYPKIISSVKEELPKEIDGVTIPVDTTGPNPNGEEMDNLYLDMNGIVHPCSHPEDRPPPQTEDEMMLEVFKYTDRVVNMCRPRKILMIAVDGVAPRAKMNQQRSRRFRSAQEAKEKEDEAAEFMKLLQEGGKQIHESLQNKKVWDSNAITPGTPFMDTLAASIRYWVAYKLNTDPAWAKLKVIISDSTVPGEGEHKIMEFIRSQRSSPEHDPNTRHVIYGLDADLIMLGLGTHEPHFRVLREDVFAQESKARACKICAQTGHRADDCTGQPKEKVDEHDVKGKGAPLKPFIWLHVSVLREYLAVELDVPGCPFPFDLERAIDDWVFMCFFVGNDFLPHLPSLDIRDGAIDTLMTIWKEKLPIIGGYITKDGSVNMERVQHILDGLAAQEDAIFQRRRQAEQRREEGNKRRKMEANARKRARRDQKKDPDYMDAITTPNQPHPLPAIPIFRPGDLTTAERKKMNHDMIMNRGALKAANEANKSVAAALKSQLLAGGEVDANIDSKADESAAPKVTPTKRKADEITDSPVETPAETDTPATEEEEANPDTVRLWEPGYQDRYYEQKFGKSPEDKEFRKQVAADYVEGLCWVLLYYFQGCPSWTWFYPHHYAPFAADFQDLKSLTIKFKKGKPFKPFEQLMGVLPAASKHNLPEPFQDLMTNPNSEIIDFYPEEFPIDLNGKKWAWQGVALLPFIEEKRLLDAVTKIYPVLSAEDQLRNGLGKEVLYMSDQHPLYNDLASQFYSKRADVKEYKIKPRISEGLAGVATKDETYIPRSTVPYPLKEGNLPDLSDDRSMSVHFKFPQAKTVHKSMLLRGVVLPPPVLNGTDRELVRRKAANTGTSYGGAPFQRNNNGRGRGRGGYNNHGGDRYQGSGGDRSYQGNRNNNPSRPPSHKFGGFNNHWAVPPPSLPAQAPGQPPVRWPNVPPPPSGAWGSYQPGLPPPPPPPSWGGYAGGGPPPVLVRPGYGGQPGGVPPPPPNRYNNDYGRRDGGRDYDRRDHRDRRDGGGRDGGYYQGGRGGGSGGGRRY